VLARHVMTQLGIRRHANELAGQRKLDDSVKTELAEARVEIAKLQKQLQAAKRRIK